MFIRFLKKVEKIMNIGRIGALINYERTKQNISIDKLRDGVCSEAVLRRIEAGERGTEFFVLERLISRLGSSSNKVELIQDEKDYGSERQKAPLKKAFLKWYGEEIE